MSKNQKKDEQTAPEVTLKTGSEKRESTKKKVTKGPELNDPLYDVQINENGTVDDVISEKAIEEVDYPPELATFLGEALAGIHEQLGLEPDEPVPEEVISEVVKKLLSGVDIETLLQELKCTDLFDVDNNESYDDLTDEGIAAMDFSKLDKDEFGNLLLNTIPLNGADKTKNTIRFIFPVLANEGVEGKRVVVHIIVPYTKKYSVHELEDGSIAKGIDSNSKLPTQDGETFFLVDGNIYEEFMDNLRRLDVPGVDDSQVDLDLSGDTETQVRELIAGGHAIQGCDENAHEDGYDPEMREYWYGGKIYHEMDVIWFEIPRTINLMGNMKGFSANLDNFIGLYEPCDITPAKNIKVKDFKRVLTNLELFEIKQRRQNPSFFEQLTPQEMVYHLACEKAKEEESAGYCIVCLNGKYLVPVESILNPAICEFEDLIVAFNVMNCFPIHHKCCGLIVTDVGNMQIHTSVRYRKGGIFDWRKRIQQEIDAYRLTNSNFDPYDDPYDDPRNAYDGPFGD